MWPQDSAALYTRAAARRSTNRKEAEDVNLSAVTVRDRDSCACMGVRLCVCARACTVHTSEKTGHSGEGGKKRREEEKGECSHERVPPNAPGV